MAKKTFDSVSNQTHPFGSSKRSSTCLALYEAANVMLTRYKGQLKLKDWAFAIAKQSTTRKARAALARRLAIIVHAMLRDGKEFSSA
jgi:hypothetical protein